MLSSERLRVMSTVARVGSFAGAAEQLFLSASAVSQQMAVLEREVGAMLFERGPRGVRMTLAGEALAAHADRIMAQLRDAMVEVEAIAACEGGRVSLGSFPSATASFAAPAVATFRDRHPKVEVRFLDGEPSESVLRLRARELDLAVVFDLESWPVTTNYDGVVIAAEAEVELIDLIDDPFFLLLPRTHPLARTPTVSLAQIADDPFIGSSHECAPWGRDLTLLCRRLGFEPDFEPRYSSIDFNSLQAFVAAGLGLTLLPQLATGSVRDDLVLRPLRDGPVRRVKIALSARSYRSPATTAMIRVLREAAGAR